MNYNKKNDTIFFLDNKLSNYPRIAISFSYIDTMSASECESKVESKVESKSKTPCKFGRNCTKGDGCKFSHDGSTSKESAGGAKPKVDSAGGAKHKVESAQCRYGIQCTNLSCTFGSHPPICLAGLNCQCIGTTCMCRHLMMCPFGNTCEKVGCTFTHGRNVFDSLKQSTKGK